MGWMRSIVANEKVRRMVVCGSILLTYSYPGYMFPGMMTSGKKAEAASALSGTALKEGV